MTKSKHTKRAMLASILSMFICLAMLIGSTFAWFTDTASTSVNKIQAGTLDVALEDADGNSLEGKTLEWKKASGAENETVLWEPGCTYELQPVFVKNNGNLALKYKIVISGVDGDAKLLEAIDFTYDGLNEDAEGNLKPGQKSGAITIKGHMKEEAGNEYQNLELNGIGITVLATQDTVEYDSKDNQYDKKAWNELVPTKVGTLEDLQTAVAEGGNIQLTDSFTHAPEQNYFGTPAIEVAENSTVDIDLGENLLTIDSKEGKDGIKGNKGATLTLSNGAIEANKAYGSSYPVIDANKGTVTLDSMTVALETASGVTVSAGVDGGKLIVKNSTITGPNTRYSNAVFVGSGSEAVIENSTINGSILVGTSGNVIIENSTIDGLLYADGKITIKSGKFTSKPETKWIAAGSTLSATQDSDGYWIVTAAN